MVSRERHAKTGRACPIGHCRSGCYRLCYLEWKDVQSRRLCRQSLLRPGHFFRPHERPIIDCLPGASILIAFPVCLGRDFLVHDHRPSSPCPQIDSHPLIFSSRLRRAFLESMRKRNKNKLVIGGALCRTILMSIEALVALEFCGAESFRQLRAGASG